MTIVCGDSHTSTHGAFGALAFGIGTSEVEMVLATQTLLQRDPLTYEVRVDGRLAPGVSAKDIILNLISRIGIGGGTGHVFEYRGEAIAGADHGTADDDLQHEHRRRRPGRADRPGRHDLRIPRRTAARARRAPPGTPRSTAGAALPSDDGATFDKAITIDADALEPMVTYGTNPGMGIPITGNVPSPDEQADPAQRRALEHALEYMDLRPGQAILGQKVDVVFVGSCTNGRISDLRLAAAALKGRHIADGVRLMVVPGSDEVKREAEAEGLSEIFKAAGGEWREAGCSMCIAMNGDQLTPGPVRGQHQQPQLRGSPGQGRPDVPGLAADRGGQRDQRRRERPAAAARHRDPGRGRRALTMGEPITVFTSKVVPIAAENVDTDQIVPARYLKITDKLGLADALFRDWRFNEDGSLKDPPFILDQPEMAGRKILLVGDNFGAGSSREHAPWALSAWGVRAIISTSYADIFRNNSLKNGVLPIAVDAATHARLVELVRADPDASLTVDLAEGGILLPDGTTIEFEIDPFAKRMLLAGTDELGYLLSKDAELRAWEAAHPPRIDSLAGAN